MDITMVMIQDCFSLVQKKKDMKWCISMLFKINQYLIQFKHRLDMAVLKSTEPHSLPHPSDIAVF